MKAKIYVELEYLDDSIFDAPDDYYSGQNGYVDAIRAEDERNIDVADNFVRNMGNNIGSGTAKFGGVGKFANAESRMHCADVEVMGDDGKPETVDNIITYCVRGLTPVFILKFDMTTVDADFEDDLSGWCGEHDRVNGSENGTTWSMEPVRDFKMEFLNKANEKTYVSLEDCKILQYDESDGEYAVIVGKITLIDSLA